VSVEAIFTGIAAIFTAAGGIVLVVREFRRRDRRAAQRELNDVLTQLERLQNDYIELRKFMLQVSELLLEHGINPPSMPESTH
jgi:hypothetical protein